MDTTKRLANYVREKGIQLSYICLKTGLSKNVIYPSLGENGHRKLRTDEFFIICKAIEADPIKVSGYTLDINIPLQCENR